MSSSITASPSSSTGVVDPSSSSSSAGRASATDGLFSTDAVFLVTVDQIYFQITVWTVVGCAFVFLCAALHGARVHALHKQQLRSRHAFYFFCLLPLLAALFGGFIGFIQGSITAALIGALANSIDSLVGVDIAAGLGLGQAIVICYFHLGRADFIHR